MNKHRHSIAFWAGVAIFLIAVLSMTQIVRNEYPFFAGYVILQFIALAVAWSILGGYAGYVNFGTNAFFGVGVYTAVALFKATGAPLVVQIGAAAVVGMLLGFGVGLLTLRMRGIFFSIATIALAIIIETFVMNWRFVGGAAGIQLQRPPGDGAVRQLREDAVLRAGGAWWSLPLRSRATSRTPGSAAACRR